MSRIGTLLLGALLLALPARAALAQEAPATAPATAPEPAPDDRVRQAAEAYDRGEFDRALELLQAAHAEAPKPALLFNMAQVQRSKGDCATAAATYRRFVDATTDDDPNRPRAERYQSDMLACAARASSAAPAPAAAPPARPLTPRAPETATSSPGLAATHPLPSRPDEPGPGWRPRRITSLALIGAGVAAAGAAGYWALKARSTFGELTEDYMDRDRRANREQWTARILGAAALVSAGAGITLLLF